MKVIKHLSAVPIRFGGEEHSGWLPANAATPPPTPVEEALVDFEISELEGGGGYIFEWDSRKPLRVTSGPPRADLWYETLEDTLEQAFLSFGIQPDQWQAVESDN
jgi:hypothetical protein